MKTSLVLIFAFVLCVNLVAQDVIVRTNGTIINCKVVSEDSTTVHINTKVHKKTVETHIQKADIQKIIYGEGSNNSSQEDSSKIPFSNTALTIGLLEGGGSLIGVDCEFLVYKNIGFQLGIGAVGYGAGLNIHFKPTTQSSFISFMYWHQGLGDSFTQSSFGPAYIFRARKLFTAQIGIAKTLEKGPGYPEDMDFPPVMLTYAIGIYLPW